MTILYCAAAWTLVSFLVGLLFGRFLQVGRGDEVQHDN